MLQSITHPILGLNLPKLNISSSKIFLHSTKVSFPTMWNGFNLSAFNFPFEKCRSHPCSTYLQALFTPEKSTKKASPTQPQKNKCIPTVFNHTKLCIYYAIRKSFTDSWLTALPEQDIVTNCKGIAMRHLARQWKLKKHDTSDGPYVMLWCARKVVHTMS